MKINRKVMGLGVAGALAAAALTAGQTSPAQAHGAMMNPGSRQFLCYEDAVTSTGEISATNPACAALIAKSGTTGLYNWFGVLRGDGAGRTTGFIPDGSLCSGTAKNYDFSGLDLARDDWPQTHLSAGANITVTYNNWAPHPGDFKMWVTKDGFDPTKPLAWSDLESEPFSVVTDPPQTGRSATIDGHYYWTAKLPSNKTGRHIIYSMWVRSDSTENFYGCSDVVFDGGNGEVTGIRGTPPNPTTSPTPTTTSPTTTTTSPTTSTTTTTKTSKTTKTTKKVSTKKVCKTGKNGKKTCKTVTITPKKTTKKTKVNGAACEASLSVTNAWGGGYQSVVTVTNIGTEPLTHWTASVAQPLDVLTQVWGDGAAVARLDGGKALLSAGSTLATGSSVSAGLVAAGTPTATPLTCSAG